MSITHLTTESFTDFTSGSTPVLVDFYADWCAPCRRMAAVLEEVTAARPAMPVGKVNVDEEPDLASAYVVRSIPTLLLLKNGEITGRWTGEVTPGTILNAIDTEALSQTEYPADREQQPSSAASSLHDYAAHTMPRMYNTPLSGMPYDGIPGQFHDLQDTWGTW